MKLKEVEKVPERSKYQRVIPILDEFRDSDMKVAMIEDIQKDAHGYTVTKLRYAIGNNTDRWPNIVVFARQGVIYLAKFEDGRRQ